MISKANLPPSTSSEAPIDRLQTASERRREREAADRERFASMIADARGDIDHLRKEIAKIEGAPAEPLPVLPKATGRPKSSKKLMADLAEISAERAWLHSRWIELRGESLFPEGSAIAKLAAERPDIVSAPRQPQTIKRGRGRPPKRAVGDAVVFWTDWFLEFSKQRGTPATKEQAYKFTGELRSQMALRRDKEREEARLAKLGKEGSDGTHAGRHYRTEMEARQKRK